MSLEQLVEKLPLFNRIDTLLVCEADFVGFRAAVLHKKGQVLSVTQHASAESLDMQEAVKELVDQLKKQGLKAEHAVMLTPAAFSSLVELSVPPKNKLSTEQMTEAVRWELEPLITQHQRVMMVGQLLLSNGYMTVDQVDQVLALIEEDNQSKSKEVVFKRFGEYARELGFITERQLERVLAKQAWFLGSIEEVQVNWTAQTQSADANSTTYPWLVAGMSKPLLREWQAAFTQHGLKLMQCYPLTGTALLGLAGKQSTNQTQTKKSKNKQKTEKPKAFLDMHEGVLSTIAFDSERVLQSFTANAHAPYLNEVSAQYGMLGLDNPKEVYWVNAASKTEQDAKLLQADIENSLAISMKAIDKPSANVSAGMRGAADHVLLNQSKHLAVSVPVADPLPPLIQRFGVRAMLGGLLLLLLIGLAEGSLWAREYWVERQIEEIAPEAEKIDEAIARVKKQIAEVKMYKGEVKAKKKKKTLNRNLALLSEDLPKRNQTVIRFLQAFEQTVSEDVVIDRVAEDTFLGFKVLGWSVSEQAAQGFVQKFQIAVHPLGYRLKDITVNQQTGRLGLLGYSINFNATTLDEAEWANAKLGIRGIKKPTKVGVRK